MRCQFLKNVFQVISVVFASLNLNLVDAGGALILYQLVRHIPSNAAGRVGVQTLSPLAWLSSKSSGVNWAGRLGCLPKLHWKWLDFKWSWETLPWSFELATAKQRQGTLFRKIHDYIYLNHYLWMLFPPFRLSSGHPHRHHKFTAFTKLQSLVFEPSWAPGDEGSSSRDHHSLHVMDCKQTMYNICQRCDITVANLTSWSIFHYVNKTRPLYIQKTTQVAIAIHMQLNILLKSKRYVINVIMSMYIHIKIDSERKILSNPLYTNSSIDRGLSPFLIQGSDYWRWLCGLEPVTVPITTISSCEAWNWRSLPKHCQLSVGDGKGGTSQTRKEGTKKGLLVNDCDAESLWYIGRGMLPNIDGRFM